MEAPPTLTAQILVLLGALLFVCGAWAVHPGLGVAAIGLTLMSASGGL